ncbi:Tetratricopeptide repeat protein [Symmachiella macrocystis]|uniref:Tetratricopeptide repeat protein n=1 Tax=Symmachiella macrocystis TaxID=2527985 RepID=A0A5C6BCD5_9PLAN|nr:tetratricopeptide repeat protein [Symmachiella macrocystis]TWU09600.1 Tetratricopeptide repeat protein [Symmachiella macrocystis]
MPEHQMIDVPEVDFMSVTENVSDWRIGKRVVIQRPKLSIALGCGVLLAVPLIGLVIAGFVMGNSASFYQVFFIAALICVGLFALVVIPYNRSNRSRETVIDWSDETIRYRHGMRWQTFPFAEIQRICVQTKQIGSETPTYDGTVDIEVAGNQFSLFEILSSTEEPGQPVDILLDVARRLADGWSVPCEVYVLGKRLEEKELEGRGRPPKEIAQKYMTLGSLASGSAMSADYQGQSDEAVEHREEAIFYYMQANKLDPTLAEPLLAIGRLSPDEAHREMAVQAALRLNPNSIPALIERGRSLLIDGREEEGFAALSQAVEKEPSVTTYHARGMSYLLSERYREAHADFSKAIALEPQDADNYSERGECLADWYNDAPDDDLLKQALADFDRAIELGGEDSTYRIERARVLLAANRFDEAIADFSRGVAVDPDSFYAYSQRGQAYLDAGHHAKQAERDFSKAVDLLEEQPRTTDSVMRRTQLTSIAFAYRSRAEARRQLGRPQQADDDIQRAIELEVEADG